MAEMLQMNDTLKSFTLQVIDEGNAIPGIQVDLPEGNAIPGIQVDLPPCSSRARAARLP